MPDYAIEVEGLGKQFQTISSASNYNLFSRQLQQAFMSAFGLSKKAKSANELFWAVQDVSFQVERGKVIGIIGGNGSGKSTLLKIMSRITPPTTGRIVINGRVSSLLEVNIGFHPELTGRENIYLLGTILGLTHAEINSNFEDIVEFADIRKFLDTAVKHFSSGMSLRLGFAIAAHLQPEVLFFDEILAVGDAAFQRKCIARMQKVAKEGRTVLIVSHQLDTIRLLCDHCFVMNKGRMTQFTDVDEALEQYVKNLGLGDESSVFTAENDAESGLQIVKTTISDQSGQARKRFDFLDPVSVEIEYVVNREIDDIYLELVVNKNGEAIVSSWDIDTEPSRLKTRSPGKYVSKVTIPPQFLKPGHHTITLNVFSRSSAGVIQRLDHALGFEIELLSFDHNLVSYGHGQGSLAMPVDWSTNFTAPISN